MIPIYCSTSASFLVLISPHPLELCGIGHFAFMEFFNSALAGFQNMSGCRILCGSVVIKTGWSLVYDSANLAPGGGHRIVSYRCRVIFYGCKLLYFRVIFRGWEWSHSIRSEILNRYWCPDFFPKKNPDFFWWIFQIVGPDSHWKSTHCSKNILLLSIKNENIVMDPKHT